ncbi:MAG: hypothetical protein KGJ23_01830 [Euryarchaeota archaeon]|nr:hypothetical protein [Euryarchaeota archaeon]MDE1835334.1 hypothetical protein [Euryarchaeota archaeon]MDE1880771.1 hypothetical protein [Euryarchaeota archaeon]MDE2043630.1 hypothetical protein [Thermoplasmata archaeon]
MPGPDAPRKVCRFRPSPPPDDPVYIPVPDDGLCLNVFPLLTEPRRPDRVLMGRIDASFDWRRIGGMHPKRVADLADRWMLPSRQLFLYEAPSEAAKLILEEQLGLESLYLKGPEVISDVWERPEPVGKGPHWDLSFIYRGEWPPGRQLHSAPWRELAFKNPLILDPQEVGRHHLDVLALAGFASSTSPPTAHA